MLRPLTGVLYFVFTGIVAFVGDLYCHWHCSVCNKTDPRKLPQLARGSHQKFQTSIYSSSASIRNLLFHSVLLFVCVKMLLALLYSFQRSMIGNINLIKPNSLAFQRARCQWIRFRSAPLFNSFLCFHRSSPFSNILFLIAPYPCCRSFRYFPFHENAALLLEKPVLSCLGPARLSQISFRYLLSK